MAEQQKKDVAASSQPADDAGQKELQERADKAEAQGFYGEEVDPLPNERYSLQSGPESPTWPEQKAALAEAEAKKENQA